MVASLSEMRDKSREETGAAKQYQHHQTHRNLQSHWYRAGAKPGVAGGSREPDTL
jgi:hypothetical protein